jgi:hypothetical protein
VFDDLLVSLTSEFPDLAPGAVERVLTSVAEPVTSLLAGDPDVERMTRVIARAQLLTLTGRRRDSARLDPEHHPNRVKRC